jgi:hypothetical protein
LAFDALCAQGSCTPWAEEDKGGVGQGSVVWWVAHGGGDSIMGGTVPVTQAHVPSPFVLCERETAREREEGVGGRLPSGPGVKFINLN